MVATVSTSQSTGGHQIRLYSRIAMPMALSTIRPYWVGKSLRWRVCSSSASMTPCLTLLKLGNACPAMMSACCEHPDELRRQYQPPPAPPRRPGSARRPAGRAPDATTRPKAHQANRNKMTMNPPVRCTEKTPTSASTAAGMRSRCRSVEVINDERRDRDAVGRQVGHRGDAELDVGHRGERRRQRRRRGRRAGSAPMRRCAAAAETR